MESISFITSVTNNINSVVFYIVQVVAYLFAFTIALSVITLFILFIIDVVQTKHSIRHNYPLIGRLRYVFEHLGTFFRQYFFAMDREELPFNRAQRSWAYQAAKNLNSTVPFGSTRNLRDPGTVYFLNCMYPTLDTDAVEAEPLMIGPYVDVPYAPKSFFNISGMSFGALSRPAIMALSKGAKMAGVWLNTGEGGLSPYHLEGGCDIVFQIGTAKFGVRNEDGSLSEQRLQKVASYEQVKMIEVKLSQGAKPGKGGLLLGVKVDNEIAEIRGIPKGKDAISPNRHPEIDNPQQLLDFIKRVRDIANKPVGIKFVAGSSDQIDELLMLINKNGIESAPDFMTLDSADGGTGAAPMSLMDNVGIPIRESLPKLVDSLKKHGLRDRIKVIASGKLINPVDVAWALCAGADFINSARGFMFSLGCIQAMQCHKNTCPTGVTTHNKRLQRGLNPEDKAVRVMHYAQHMIKEVCVIAHSCGVREPRKLKRHFAHVVLPDGSSINFAKMYPDQ